MTEETFTLSGHTVRRHRRNGELWEVLMNGEWELIIDTFTSAALNEAARWKRAAIKMAPAAGPAWTPRFVWDELPDDEDED